VFNRTLEILAAFALIAAITTLVSSVFLIFFL